MFANIKKFFLKEVKELLNDKQLMKTLLIYCAIGILISMVIIFSDNDQNLKNIYLCKIIILGFMIYLFYLIFNMMVTNRFMNDSIENMFNPLLSLPMSLKEICLGKLLAVISISYPFTILILIIISILYYLLDIVNIMQSSLMFFFILFLLMPLIITTYYSLCIWLYLLFKNKNILVISNMCVMLCLTLTPLLTKQLFPNFDFSNLLQNMNLNVVNIIFVAIIIIFFIIIQLIGKLDKNKLLS
ncbi:MAG: hypothetical protein LBR15_01555 [Methanobrevibacter sp.]|jgi:hypothetical protein|nr:hypothetical protein [Candidatus Methanovirga australis]